MTVPGRSRLAATRKEATKVFCRLPGNDVAAFAVAAPDLARSGGPESGQVVRDHAGARDPPGQSAGGAARAGPGRARS